MLDKTEDISFVGDVLREITHLQVLGVSSSSYLLMLDPERFFDDNFHEEKAQSVSVLATHRR